MESSWLIACYRQAMEDLIFAVNNNNLKRVEGARDESEDILIFSGKFNKHVLMVTIAYKPLSLIIFHSLFSKKKYCVPLNYRVFQNKRPS